MPRRRLRRGFPPSIVPLLALAGGLAGCGGAPETDSRRDVPVSDELLPHLEESRRSLQSGDRGDPRVHADLDRYFAIATLLSSRDHRAAGEDSLYAAWSADPHGVLWPDLTAFYRNRVNDLDRLQAIFDRPDFPDSSTALGAYLREWRRSGPRPDGSGYERAAAARHELTPFENAWFGIRYSRHALSRGDADRALQIALEGLPDARATGWRTEMKAWIQIMSTLRRAQRLDDALHAATMAEEFARAVSAMNGDRLIVLEARFYRANILADRRDSEIALELYGECAAAARDAGLILFEGTVLNRAGLFTDTLGRYEDGLRMFHAALSGALTISDSLDVPRHLANIADRHRKIGNLDSCRVYLDEAERWIRAHPDPANEARFPLFQAEYFAQVGDYGAVDSLHALAAQLTPRFSPMQELAELHLQMIRQGTERGRPVQVYRSLALLDSLRSRLLATLSDRNELFDLDLAAADFLGRQGIFPRAESALDRAAEALERRPDPGRAWELSGARGHLARLRGNSAEAEAAYRECVARSRELGDPDRLGRSRVWLAAHLLEEHGAPAESGEIDEILASDDAHSGLRLRTRTVESLLRASLHSRRGRHEAALDELEEARARFRSDAAPDLTVQLELATGRALSGVGRHDDAAEAFARARDLLVSERMPFAARSGMFLDRDLSREAAEATLEHAFVRHGAELSGKLALETLRAVQIVLPAWHRADGRIEAPAEPQILYFVGERVSGRWVAHDGGLRLRRLPGEAALIREIGPRLADLRSPARPPTAADPAELTRILGGRPGAPGPITVVPDGPLFSVPWATLAVGDGTGDRWIDRGAILVADSPREASPPARERTGPRSLSLIAIGADATAAAEEAGLDPLHHAEDEAREIHGLWPADLASLSIGSAASRDAVLSGQLAGHQVIHVSSHAKAYQGVADQTTLYLAGASGTPVTAAEIRELDLDAELVFLSCCEAMGGIRRGVGPAHAGLARSFLAAGARHVIASGIPVDDRAARALARSFYSHWLGGADLEDALRRAQLDVRENANWAHPYYWAYYQVIVPHGS